STQLDPTNFIEPSEGTVKPDKAQETKNIALTETPSHFNDLDLEKKLSLWHKQYQESLHISGVFRHFEDAKNPEITTITGKKVKAPRWDKVKAAISAPDVLEKVKLLKNPTLLIVPAGQSFQGSLDEVSQDKIEEKDKKSPRFPYLTSWNEKIKKEDGAEVQVNGTGGDQTAEVISFDPDNPAKGETKEQRHGETGWEVLIVDGCDEVPEETKKKKAIELAQDLGSKGLSLLSKEAYLHLQQRGSLRGRNYDQKIWTWLDEYIKSFSAVACAYWNPDLQGLSLNRSAPSASTGILGGRRSVRVKIP
ncbi:MAG: hypothetical protein AABX37_02105, partial [Nanoarchaeota archaeon]